MKPGLKRIEATLDQLDIHKDSPIGIAADSSNFGTSFGQAESSSESSNVNQSHPPYHSGDEPRGRGAAKAKLKIQVEAFPVPDDSLDADLETQQEVGQGAVAGSAREHLEAKLPVLPVHPALEPSPTSTGTAANPADLVQSTASSAELLGLGVNRQAANPNLAIGILQEIGILVKGWQKDLEQTLQQIQGVYQDGPIVDGWLESYPPGGQAAPPHTSLSMLRHAEIEYLMEFIEQICTAEQAPITEDMRRTNYRLCGLDPDGKVWSRPCPPEQVPYVGLAIARYQKLRTLLAKKQLLENRLTHLVETLTMVHGQIKD